MNIKRVAHLFGESPYGTRKKTTTDASPVMITIGLSFLILEELSLEMPGVNLFCAQGLQRKQIILGGIASAILDSARSLGALTLSIGEPYLRNSERMLVFHIAVSVRSWQVKDYIGKSISAAGEFITQFPVIPAKAGHEVKL